MKSISLTMAALVVSIFPTMAAAAEGDAARGETVFKRCSACHAPTDVNKVGPGLLGVVGRKAGTAPNYQYSKQLVDSNITWDEANLDAYLTAPRKLVNGTKMSGAVANQKDRDDVIAYLKKLVP
ncbi:c-type cytochrome [Rhizobium leguminosarum]|uniref:c-type cytochrome n=1 Tax=Rhizobium leguminosarum TaxID=384 RepID=UPI003F94841C